ncbi:MAG: hypothetical protein ACO3EZ_01525 [Prochlorotrichaceae cyanobacterium]
MNRKLFSFLFSLVALTVLPSSQNAKADEVWDTGEYQVIYQDDRGKTAVWTYGDGIGTVFIEGLAGVIENRGSYDGYWVQDSSSLRCDTYREGSNGSPSYYWGRFEINFIDQEFPSRWQAKLGRCEGEPSITLDGVPIFKVE